MTGSSWTNPLPAGTHLGRSSLSVLDRTAVAEYYRTVVGLAELHAGTDATILGAGETPLLVLEDATEREARSDTAAGLYHNAFRMPTRGALGDALGRLRDHDALEGAADHRVSEALYSTDPEGNGVEIYRDYPRENWPRTDDGRLGMSSEALDLDALATAAAGASGLPAGSDLGHVHCEVTSLGAFRASYVDAIGFAVRAELPGAAFVAAGGYHHHVAANVWHRRRTPAEGPGLSWFEIVVPDADALAAARERIAASGFSTIEPDTWFGADSADGFAVTDPDGIQVRLRTE